MPRFTRSELLPTLTDADRVISLDTETCGLDFFHGVKPFIVVSTNAVGKTQLWQWEVDPLTRRPAVTDRDLADIASRLDHAETVVLHNSKFDAHALDTLGLTLPWDKVEDTLCAAHVLGSSDDHDLTSCARSFVSEALARRSEALEAALEHHIKAARTYCRFHLTDWKTARDDDPNLPSAKGGGDEGPWRNDYWLPRAVALRLLRLTDEGKEVEYPTCGPEGVKAWLTSISEYAVSDSATTVMVWAAMKRALENRKLWATYRARFEGVPVAYRMECNGVSVSGTALREAQATYGARATDLGATAVGVARSMGYELTLPKKGTNQNLDDFVFGRAPRDPDEVVGKKVKKGKRRPDLPRTPAPDTLNLPVVGTTESGNPSFDSDARRMYLGQLKPASKAHLFVACLDEKADLDTGLTYLSAYERFALPDGDDPDRLRIHPNLNPFGTDTLRWSHNNPNSANISERSVVNARKCFGPTPDREWADFDGENLELRIPVFEADETEIMDVFLHPERGPYYGSYHLVIFEILHPALFKEHGPKVKDLFKVEYGCTKNFTFCRQYGGQEALADATARVPGATRLVGRRYPKVEALSKKWIEFAQKNGYVETLPDRSVDPDRGYPLLVKRGTWGRVKPTTPFCYHVSGTACQWMNRAMVKSDQVLQRWKREDGFDARMILQIHDSLVFDLPARGDDADGKPVNLARMRELGAAMSSCGDDIGIPTPVSLKVCRTSWAEGVKL